MPGPWDQAPMGTRPLGSATGFLFHRRTYGDGRWPILRICSPPWTPDNFRRLTPRVGRLRLGVRADRRIGPPFAPSTSCDGGVQGGTGVRFIPAWGATTKSVR